MGSFFWIALLAIVTAVTIGLWASFARWKRSTLARLRGGAQLTATVRGPIECAVFGEGPAVLISHGVLGGYDQSLAGIASGFFGERSHRFIALSRPGYLRTPVEVGRTPEELADAFAALLDVLEIEKPVVVGVSGGGPPSLQFALRHADRCAALLLVSAVTERIPRPERGDAGVLLHAIMGADFLAWLALGLARRFPRLIFRSILSPDELRRLHEPVVLTNLLRLMDTTAPISARRLGLMADGAYLTIFPPYPLAEIRVPVLVLHGTSDKIVPFASAKRTAAAIPGARFVSIDKGGHFACFLGASGVSNAVHSFLEKVAG